MKSIDGRWASLEPLDPDHGLTEFPQSHAHCRQAHKQNMSIEGGLIFEIELVNKLHPSSTVGERRLVVSIYGMRKGRTRNDITVEFSKGIGSEL